MKYDEALTRSTPSYRATASSVLGDAGQSVDGLHRVVLGPVGRGLGVVEGVGLRRVDPPEVDIAAPEVVGQDPAVGCGEALDDVLAEDHGFLVDEPRRRSG